MVCDIRYIKEHIYNSAKVRPIHSNMPQEHHFTIPNLYLRLCMQKVWLAFICLLGFSQCNNKVYSLRDLPQKYIEIGSSGGFAGTAKRYYFFPNGQRFVSKGSMGTVGAVDAQEIESATPKDFKEILKSLKKMDFKAIDLNELGNMTYYIKLKTRKEEKGVQWSNMDTAPKALVEVYRSALMNINTTAIN